MKKNNISHALLVLSVIITFCSCSKSKENIEDFPGSPQLELSMGVLCTMGLDHTGREDTLGTMFGHGLRDLQGYGPGYIPSKFEVQLTNSGNNSWRLQLITPLVSGGKALKYIGFAKNKSVGNPNNSSLYPQEYLYEIYENPQAETEFVMNKEDKKFYLEPVNLRGYYLISYRHPYSSGNAAAQHRLLFEKGIKQKYFFMKN